MPGRSRSNPSRYRIRTEVLQTGLDRFRCPLTDDKTPLVTDDNLSQVTDDKTPSVTDDILDTDRRHFVPRPTTFDAPTDDKTPSVSVNRVLTELEQISDQSARDGARTDDASKDAEVEQRNSADEDALKTEALRACGRAVGRLAGEDGDSAVKLADAVTEGLPPGWLEQDDARRREILEAGKRRKAAM